MTGRIKAMIGSHKARQQQALGLSPDRGNEMCHSGMATGRVWGRRLAGVAHAATGTTAPIRNFAVAQVLPLMPRRALTFLYARKVSKRA